MIAFFGITYAPHALTCASSPGLYLCAKARDGGVTPSDTSVSFVARESRLMLCLSVFTVSSIGYSRACQEKAEHGPGTEYTACLRKSSYSSEYVNDAIAI